MPDPSVQDPAERLNRRLAFSPAETAEALGLSRAGVYNLMAAGVIRSVKLGASRRVPREELERLLSEPG